MPNTTFWQPNGKINNTNGVKSNLKKTFNLKKLGISGVVVLVILSIVGLIGFIFIVKPALSMTVHINALRTDQKELSEALKARDVVAMEKALDKTEIDLNDLRTARDNNFKWAK